MSFRIGINLGGERPYYGYGGGNSAQALYMAEIQQAQQAQWQQAAYGQMNSGQQFSGQNFGNPQVNYQQQQQQERYAAYELATGGNPNDISQRLSAEFCGPNAYQTVQRINNEARQEAFRHHLQGPVDSLQVLADGSIGEVNNYTGQTVGRIPGAGQNPQNYYANNMGNGGYPPVNPSNYYANGFNNGGYNGQSFMPQQTSYYPPNGGYYLPPALAMSFGGRGGYGYGGGGYRRPGIGISFSV